MVMNQGNGSEAKARTLLLAVGEQETHGCRKRQCHRVCIPLLHACFHVLNLCVTHVAYGVSLLAFGFRGSADSQGWQETCNVGPVCPRQHWQDYMPLDQMQFCAHIITDKASAGQAQTLRELLLALKTEWGLWKFSPTFTVGINLVDGLGVC